MGVFARIPRVMRYLAFFYRRTLIRNVRVVAVVGSFGKTSTLRATAYALGIKDPSYTIGNWGVGLSFALLRIRPWARYGVVEVGISGKGQMERWARLVRPDIAVVTCIGSEHMTSLGSLEVTREEKAKMVSAVPPSGMVVLNGDDPNVVWMESLARAPVITYGFGSSSQVRATDVVETDSRGVRFKAHVQGKVYDVSTQLFGRHMVYPFLAALAVALAEKQDLRKAITLLKTLDPTWNRLQPIRLPGGALLLVDAFKGALETITAALETLSRLSAQRKVVVIGDVEEPPGSQGPIYRDVGIHLAAVCDGVIFVGGKKNFQRLKAGMRSGGLPLESLTNARNDPHAIAQALEGEVNPGTVILIKGRSNQHLERVALILSGVAVSCTARVCSRHHDCETCPLLQYGHVASR